ncbi:MAG: DUF3369 domain-containing protein [Clostridiaceae bacterium]|nr:DUF3369 domain-containing protein [Clostridiaceae bacterium]
MSKILESKDIELDFLSDEEEIKPRLYGKYKIVIADDDEEVHTVTKMILKDFEFEGKTLEFIDAYNGKETKEVLLNNPNTAILFLDVVMEEQNSGLEVVEYLRKTLKNKMTRIILRTGQPGEAPEEKVIKEYDINDYRLKTEMTVTRLHTTMYSALRNYRDMLQIDKNRRGLEKIIETSANLFKHNTLDQFLSNILSQLSCFYQDDAEILYIREAPNKLSHGFVTLDKSNIPTIASATGKYTEYIGKNIEDISELEYISKWIEEGLHESGKIHFIGNGFIIKNSGENSLNNYIFIEGDSELYDFELINLFLTNYSVALNNYILNTMLLNTQREIITTLGEVVENHFEDTAGHVKRISEMMYKFALYNGFSSSEAEVLKIASTMHDIGKIAIPDAILKKRGRLTDEEFEVIKEHTIFGNKILSKSELDIFRIAAEIALNHHEKYNGTGYPNNLFEKDIPLSSRMMAIIDVFDAMTHKRVYKEAISIEETLEYLKNQKGLHFDPKLVDIFLENLNDILHDV